MCENRVSRSFYPLDRLVRMHTGLQALPTVSICTLSHLRACTGRVVHCRSCAHALHDAACVPILFQCSPGVSLPWKVMQGMCSEANHTALYGLHMRICAHADACIMLSHCGTHLPPFGALYPIAQEVVDGNGKCCATSECHSYVLFLPCMHAHARMFASMVPCCSMSYSAV